MQRSLLVLVLVTAVLTVIPAFAQKSFDASSFNGTWHLNLKSAQIKSSLRHYALKDGTWSCDTCVPKLSLKVDGQVHSISGSPYMDSASGRVVNDNTIEFTSMKDGKQVGTTKLTASEDGKKLTLEDTFTSENGQQGSEKDILDRVGAVPTSGNKTVGTWREVKIADTSENASTITFKATDDGLSMSDGTGDSYDAKFDGKDYPYKGDPGTTSVSLKKVGPNTIEETDKRDGKVISVIHMTVEPGGKTMKLTIHDTLHSDTTSMTATKE